MMKRNTVIGSVPAPPGATPNFEHPQDVFYTLNLAVQISCIAVTTPSVLLRSYIKARIVKVFGIEDWCCLIAWIFSTYFFASGIVLGQQGGGYHDWELTTPAFMRFKKTLYFDIIFHSPTTFFVKATLLLLFVRVFSPKRNVVRGIYCFATLLLLYYTSTSLAKVWVCTPIGAFWNPAIRKSCIDTDSVFRMDNILSVITDLVILILPVPLMWSVQVTRKKKIGISMLLGAGGLATSCSGARLIITSAENIHDATLAATQFKMLAVAELAIALTCACVPSFNVLYSRLREKYRAKHSAYDPSVKMSTFSYSRKGSRGIKGKPAVTYIEDGSLGNSSLEDILNNTTQFDDDYRYKVQVFSGNGMDSSDPGMTTSPKAWVRGAQDQGIMRSIRNTDMV
ncbi:hypothetical protein BKA64DRAFT_111454 [Cadophora sp. MPI-SDFR-AT-0126]|nr:hypothetical protein BKA64DRAFT_111454 [Leotiomycetes sp. MPI-SDFR-AT-0126]